MPTVLMIAHGSRDPASITEMQAFGREAARRLPLPVRMAFLELTDPPAAVALRALVEAGERHVIVMPLLVGPAGHQKNDIPALIHWARAEWPHVRIEYGTPFDTHALVVQVLHERIAAALDAHPPRSEAETAIVLAGRGSTDPDSNSNLYKLARLLWEGHTWLSVEVAFYSLTRPRVPDAVARAARLGARRVVLAPHFLFTGLTLQWVREQAEAAACEWGMEFVAAEHMGLHPLLFELLQVRLQEVLSGRTAMNCDACKYRFPFAGMEAAVGQPQTSDEEHGLRGIA